MKKALLLLGPTGVGKTAASLLLAQELNTEIISADSMQVYRHMDIGTAKPSRADLSHIRHHMIDIIEPWEAYSTGQYIAEVEPIMDGLCSRGLLPLITGGTGLYMKAMTRGIFHGPSTDQEIRTRLLLDEETTPGTLYLRLTELDPSAARQIMPNDLRRIVRALEVVVSSGIRISDMQAEQTVSLPYEFIKVGLTRDRDELYRIINRRVDTMITSGLPDEVKLVLNLIKGKALESSSSALPGLSTSELSSMQAIGYKELLSHFEGRLSFADAVELIKQRSRNYAKRQFTWFRKEEGIEWIDISGIFDAEEIKNRVLGCLKK